MKKQPERICAVCRESKPKSELIRLVRVGSGEINLDPSGKKQGRGAYLCLNPECIKKVKKQRGLERSLRGKIPEELWLEIEQFREGLIKNE